VSTRIIEGFRKIQCYELEGIIERFRKSHCMGPTGNNREV
jgi:hypothetical protein